MAEDMAAAVEQRRKKVEALEAQAGGYDFVYAVDLVLLPTGIWVAGPGINFPWTSAVPQVSGTFTVRAGESFEVRQVAAACALSGSIALAPPGTPEGTLILSPSTAYQTLDFGCSVRDSASNARWSNLPIPGQLLQFGSFQAPLAFGNGSRYLPPGTVVTVDVTGTLLNQTPMFFAAVRNYRVQVAFSGVHRPA